MQFADESAQIAARNIFVFQAEGLGTAVGSIWFGVVKLTQLHNASMPAVSAKLFEGPGFMAERLGGMLVKAEFQGTQNRVIERIAGQPNLAEPAHAEQFLQHQWDTWQGAVAGLETR